MSKSSTLASTGGRSFAAVEAHVGEPDPHSQYTTAAEVAAAIAASSTTPTAHATSHKSGGSDAIKLDELAAPTDVTTLNASTTAHGLMPKGTGSTSTYYRSDLTQANPLAIGNAVGSGTAGRILYQGAGPVLADSANLQFDGTNLGVGVALPKTTLHIAGAGVAGYGHVAIDNFSDNAVGPTVSHRKARGTSGTPSAVLSGDTLGRSDCTGYHSGGAFSNSAGVAYFVANENFSSTAQGTLWRLGLTPKTVNAWSTVLEVSPEYSYFKTYIPGVGWSERLKLTQNNVTISGNTSVGATIPGDPSGAKGALILVNGTAPSGRTVDGTILYTADDGAGNAKLWVMNEAATAGAIVTKQNQSFTSGRVPFATTEDRLTDDGALFWDNTNKRLGIGTTAPDYVLESVSSSSNTVLSGRYAAASDVPAAVLVRKSRGTATSPSAVSSGDGVGYFGAIGYHSGGGWGGTCGAIAIYADESFTSSAQGTHMRFRLNAAGTAGGGEKMRLSGAGNLHLFADNAATADPTSATATIVIKDGTAPTGDISTAAQLYADTVSSVVEMRVRDSAGNVTTISPHNRANIPYAPTHDLAWTFHSELPALGKSITCDMYELARAVEALAARFNLPRKQFIYEGTVPTDAEMTAHHEAAEQVRRDYEAQQRAAGAKTNDAN